MNAVYTDRTYTIVQSKGDTRPLQALYDNKDGTGTVGYLRSIPALGVENRPNNGGSALATSRFTANTNGVSYMSFDADLAAVGYKGDYVVDKADRGLDDGEMLTLIASLDYLYGRSAFAGYNDIALANIIVWNLLIKFDAEPMLTDLWMKNVAAGISYKDAWGKLYKVEGDTNASGSNQWYTAQYKALVDDILANSGKYVQLYQDKLSSGTGKYISGACFLKGDGLKYENFWQGRQFIIEIADLG